MKKPNSYFGNKTATVTKKSSAITTHITQAAKHCVWLGHGKMGVLPHYSINKKKLPLFNDIRIYAYRYRHLSIDVSMKCKYNV